MPKAIEKMWILVMYVVLYLIFRFARSLKHHQAHMIDAYDYDYVYSLVYLCIGLPFSYAFSILMASGSHPVEFSEGYLRLEHYKGCYQ